MPRDNRQGERAGDAATLPAPSVSLAARILEHLAHDAPRAGLSEIARALGANKSTCFGVLRTLEHFGFVLRAPGRTEWQLGPKLVDLGTAVRRNLSFRSLLRRNLMPLVAELGVACVVAQMLGDRKGYVIMDRIAPPDDDGVAPPIGFTYPITAPAIGRAALSCLYEDEALEIVGSLAVGSRERDMEAWRADLTVIRATGFSTSREEYRLGVNAVAVPVRFSGEPALVIGLVGAAKRLPASKLATIGGRLRQIGRSLEVGSDRADHVG